MKKDNRLWQESLKPIVVLTVICLITSLLLAVTNSLTAPIIAEQKRAAANAARKELLPDADDFEQVTCEAEGITDYYRATNGAGVVISANGKGGYGGDVPVMVSFDAAGKILAVKVDAGGETAGKGDKVAQPAFTDQFKGREAKPEPMKMGTDVQAVAGSTVTSGAALNGVNRASAAYNLVEKGVASEEKVLTQEEMAALAAPDSGTLTLEKDAVLTKSETDDTEAKAVYSGENGDTVIVTTGSGYENHPITVCTAFNGEGTVIGIYVDASQQTEGLGTKVAEPAFIDQLIGKKPPLQLGADVDGVAGATFSSKGVINGVNEAAACYAANASAGGEG